MNEQQPDRRQAIPGNGALFVDLYELTMAQSYFAEGLSAEATFSLFARHLPRGWRYFLAAGLDDALAYLEGLRFTPDDLVYLEATCLFTPAFLDYLGGLRFTGSVRALPEGTLCYPNEPLLEVTAPLIEAQLVETAVLNQVHLQTILASEAARCVQAAKGGAWWTSACAAPTAATRASRSPAAPTWPGSPPPAPCRPGSAMASPSRAPWPTPSSRRSVTNWPPSAPMSRAYPDACALLVDTYETLEGVRRAAVMGQELAAADHRLVGVRLDSGDLLAQALAARQVPDQAGLPQAIVFASGGVDEHLFAPAVARAAPSHA